MRSKTHTIEIPRGESDHVEDYSWSSAGSHDNKSEGFSIERIVDRGGRFEASAPP